jgi:hypothetical protein
VTFLNRFWTEYPESSIKLWNYWECLRAGGGFANAIWKEVRISAVRLKKWIIRCFLLKLLYWGENLRNIWKRINIRLLIYTLLSRRRSGYFWD